MKEGLSRRRLVIILSAILLIAGMLCFFLMEGRPASGLAGMKILLAGDSRSSADYSFYKTALEKKTGCIALVEGASGKTAAYNASDEYFTKIIENDHDFSIWLVGGNDDGRAGSVGTFSAASSLGKAGEPVVTETDLSKDYDGNTFIQAIDHIMRKYKAEYDGRKNGKGRIPVMIFCTDLPQQRESKDSPWSRKENWERKRQAILECCEKNGVCCLDLYELCGFDMDREPIYTEPTDTENNRGEYYMDGLHPNEKGIDRITDLEIEMMKQCLNQST